MMFKGHLHSDQFYTSAFAPHLTWNNLQRSVLLILLERRSALFGGALRLFNESGGRSNKRTSTEQSHNCRLGPSSSKPDFHTFIERASLPASPVGVEAKRLRLDEPLHVGVIRF